MKLTDYYDLLAGHDWLYYYSDDPKVYSQGRKVMTEIEKVSKESKAHHKLYEEWSEYSNPPTTATGSNKNKYPPKKPTTRKCPKRRRLHARGTGRIPSEGVSNAG